MRRTDPLDRHSIVGFIEEIFLRHGADSYLGEAVTMSSHMLQSAMLAERAGADEEIIAAALLHDIGHYRSEFPPQVLARGVDDHHDSAGAALIAPWFAPRVASGVRWHVQAKRYLCAVEKDYFATLSEASVHTLERQGGPMTPGEAREFARRDDLDAILAVRRFDEAAKVAGAATPPFAHYAPLLQRLVTAAA